MLLPASAPRTGRVGVTTFLKTNLMMGKKFRRVGGGKRRSHAGLCIGRQVDRAFTDHVVGTAPYNPTNAKHARLGHVVRALREAGIVPCRAQVPLVHADLGIRSVVDAVGVRGKDVCIIELKATTYTRAEHERLYGVPCYNNPTLANGLPNSEAWLHLLQAGFGVVAARRVLTAAVQGVVVVAYACSARVIAVPASACNPMLFVGGSPRPTAPVAKRTRVPGGAGKAVFAAWPDYDERVKRVVSAHGGHAVEAGPGTSVIVHRADGTGPLFVAGCVRARWSTVSAASRRRIAALLLKSAAHVFGDLQTGCNAYVLMPHGKHWRLRSVGTPAR